MIHVTARSFVSVLVALLASAGCSEVVNGPGDNQNDGSGITGSASVLVFVSERDEDRELFRIDPDGSDLQQLTNNSSEDTRPDCAVDGSRIAFRSERHGDLSDDLYTMSVDGGDVTRLTNRSDHNDRLATWGPDGNRIAFGTQDRAQFGEPSDRLALMDPDGSNIRGAGDSISAGVYMDWSPEGAGIAVSVDVPPADQGQGWDLVRTDTLGNWTALHEDTTVSATHPAWSTTSSRLAYVEADPDGAYADIYTMARDGSDRTPVLTHDSLDVFPAWSPDGSRLAFSSNRSGNYEIYVADTDGSNVQQVTDNSARDFLPAWCQPSN